MADDKQDVLDMLKELGELTILDEGDPQSFRVRAYESARHGVEAFGGELGKLSAKELEAIDGIGKSTALKIRELLEKGKVDKLEELRQKHPAAVVALMRIQGLGPKAVNRLRKELGVDGLPALKEVLASGKLAALKGFGKKTEENLKRTLERMQTDSERYPIAVAAPIAERIAAAMREVPGVESATVCGSLRRMSETVGDVDVVVAATEARPVLDAFLAMRLVDQVLGSGETKASVLTRRGLQVDVRVVRPDQIGAAQLYFTGSKSHNIKLRMRALDRGMTLNEYALTEVETGRIVASRTETEVYAALGLVYIDPVLREDAGEIELAAKDELPKSADPRALVGDFHVHTSLSRDATAPIADVVRTARARGYTVLAITEHAQGLGVAGVTKEQLIAQRADIEAMRAEVGDAMTILHGIELNIGPEGELDYDHDFRMSLDFCLASIHDHFDLDKAAQTRRVVKAMEDPSVHMIGHLSGRMIGGRPPVPLDLAQIFSAAEATGTALEVNGGLPRLDVSVDTMRGARTRGVTFVLTSDAHRPEELARIENACKTAHKAWIDPARIANTWSRERMLAWLSEVRAGKTARA